MARKNISESCFSMSHEFNFKGRKMETRSKSKPCTAVKLQDMKQPVNLASFIPCVMGAVPSCSGLNPLTVMERAVLGASCMAGSIMVGQNDLGFNLSYMLPLLKVINGAAAKMGSLNEDELKKLIMAFMAQMLEKAGPGFSSWKQVLMDLMQNATLKDFMKGVQSAVCALTGDPVNANTGNFIYDKEDIYIKGSMPIFFKRTYNRIDTRTGCMGTGWRHNYEIELLVENDRYVIIWEDGREEIYMRNGDGSIEPLFGCLCRLKQKEDRFTYQTQEGLCYTFDAKGCLLGKRDLNGQGLHFTYNRQEKLETVSNDNGGKLIYRYDISTGRLLTVQDHTGRQVIFEYELGRLCKVTNPMGQSYSYYYDDHKALYKIKNPRNVVVIENKYDDKGRTIRQIFADGGKIQYDYQEEDCRTLVTQQDDSKIAYYHDERFRNVKTVYVDGEERFVFNERNQLIQEVDKNGNKTKYAYDNKGNKTQVINPDGSKHSMTYDADNRLLVMSVNGIAKIKNTYDSKGNILNSEDAIGNSKEFRYSDTGKITEIIQADQSRILLAYDNRGNIIQVTDAQGNVTSYSYNELNCVVNTTDGNGNQTSYQYDDCGQIKKVTNALGKNRSYEYTKNGKLSKVIDYNGSVISQIYNPMNQVETVILPDGGKHILEYDLMQNISKRVAPNGAEIKYQYDSLNRLVQITLATGGIISYAYDPNGNRTGITDVNGGCTLLEYDEMNRITAITDAAAARTEYEYDMDGNVVRMTNPLGKSSTYIYNEAGQKIKETDIMGNTYCYEYNKLNKLSCITDSKQHKTRYEYNPGGILKKAISPMGHFELYSYDKNCNLIRRENHKGDFLEFNYDCLDRMIMVKSSFDQKQYYTYDAAGNITSVKDTLGNVTHYTYSPGGKLTSVLDAEGNRTEYAYDAMGELITICQHEGEKILLNSEYMLNSDNVHITSYKRNLLGKVEAIISPLGLKEEYTYDLAGQLLLKKDQEGYETRYAYTPTGEVEKITYSDDRSVKLAYNPLRQLIEIQDWLGITKIETDDMGRTEKITDYKGREIGYQWNQEGQREAIIYPDGRKIVYEYDEFFRLSHLKDGNRDIQYQYDEEGRLTEKKYPEGISSIYDYNRMGLLNCLAHKKNECYLEKYTFEYDKMSNRTGLQKTRYADISSVSQEMERKLNDENGYYKYQYDSLNRLTEVRKNKALLHRYEYDAFGNRIRQETDTMRKRYYYNAANQLLRTEGVSPEESYRYDARGNLTAALHGKEIVNQYIYDETNRLSIAMNDKGEAVKYQYDGLGNRVGAHECLFNKEYIQRLYTVQSIPSLFEKPTKEIDYLLDRTKAYHNLLEKTEIKEERSRSQTYTWEREIAFMTEGDTAHIFLKDELGSPVRLVEMGKNQQIIYGYDEFGQDLYGNQGACQPFGYTGYRKDRIAGTYFAQAREYFPEMGRFGGEDWVRGNLYHPFTQNRYIYCYSNAINLIDLDGKRARNTGPSRDDVMEWWMNELYQSADRAWRETLNAIYNWFDDTVDVKVEFGKGVGVKGTIHGVEVGGNVKQYIEIDENFEMGFKGEAGITAGKEDLFEVGLSEEYDYLTGKITPKIGVSGVDWDGTLKSSFGGEVYAGIGGGAYITIDWIKVGDAFYHFGKALIGCDSQN